MRTWQGNQINWLGSNHPGNTAQRAARRAAVALFSSIGISASLLLAGTGTAMADSVVVGTCTIVSNPTPTIHTVCPNANLSGANLSRRNLTSADLHGANLSNANLANANLTAANLSGTTLTGANFGGAILTDSNAKVIAQ